jgi:hypothetical protein
MYFAENTVLKHNTQRKGDVCLIIADGNFEKFVVAVNRGIQIFMSVCTFSYLS